MPSLGASQCPFCEQPCSLARLILRPGPCGSEVRGPVQRAAWESPGSRLPGPDLHVKNSLGYLTSLSSVGTSVKRKSSHPLRGLDSSVADIVCFSQHITQHPAGCLSPSLPRSVPASVVGRECQAEGGDGSREGRRSPGPHSFPLPTYLHAQMAAYLAVLKPSEDPHQQRERWYEGPQLNG